MHRGFKCSSALSKDEIKVLTQYLIKEWQWLCSSSEHNAQVNRYSNAISTPFPYRQTSIWFPSRDSLIRPKPDVQTFELICISLQIHLHHTPDIQRDDSCNKRENHSPVLCIHNLIFHNHLSSTGLAWSRKDRWRHAGEPCMIMPTLPPEYSVRSVEPSILSTWYKCSSAIKQLVPKLKANKSSSFIHGKQYRLNCYSKVSFTTMGPD